MNSILIKSLREAATLSQQDLADASGLSRGMITHIEHGRSNGSLDTLDKIANGLAKFIDLSYVAGLFDRKSTIGILRINPVSQKSKSTSKYHGGWCLGYGYMARVEFRTKHKILAQVIQKVFNFGSISYSEKISTYVVMFWADNAGKFLDKILPYLKVKRPQAELILELRELQKINRQCTPRTPKRTGEKVNPELFIEAVCRGDTISRLAISFNISYKTARNLKRQYLEFGSLNPKIRVNENYDKYLLKAAEIHEKVQLLNRVGRF